MQQIIKNVPKWLYATALAVALMFVFGSSASAQSMACADSDATLVPTLSADGDIIDVTCESPDGSDAPAQNGVPSAPGLDLSVVCFNNSSPTVDFTGGQSRVICRTGIESYTDTSDPSLPTIETGAPAPPQTTPEQDFCESFAGAIWENDTCVCPAPAQWTGGSCVLPEGEGGIVLRERESTCGSFNEDCRIFDTLNTILNIATLAVLPIIAIMIAIGGIQYSAAQGNPSQVQAAKDRIYKAITALIIFVFLWSFLQWLIPGGILEGGADTGDETITGPGNAQ